MFNKHTLSVAALLAFGVPSAMADIVDYSFSGTYNTIWNGNLVSLDYSGTFKVTDPTTTLLKPAHAADPDSPGYAGIWAGTSVFYAGGTDLSITFSNGATVSAAVLDIVVNNTTLSDAGAPYPYGLSAQIYTRGAAAMGMTANTVCADGTFDDACDDSGDDPIYEKGDASDLTVQHMTGVYFAFYSAPLQPAGAGVPDFATAFGGGGLGIYSTNELGQNVTTLTTLRGISSITTLSPVPEPGSWPLWALGLSAIGLKWGRRQRAA